MRASKHSIPKTALALAAAIAIPSVARASLTIDVQLPTGGKSAVVSAPGEQVQLQVFAVVTGTNATGADDGLQIAQGSFLSTGALQGSLAASVIAPFTGVGSAGGSVSDLDSDGDADVGSNNNAAGTGFWIARSDSPQSPNGYPAETPPIPASSFGSVTGASYRVQLGTLTFTISSSLAQSTAVNFRPRSASSAALWFEEVLSPSKTPSNGVFAAAAIPVTITLAPSGTRTPTAIGPRPATGPPPSPTASASAPSSSAPSSRTASSPSILPAPSARSPSTTPAATPSPAAGASSSTPRAAAQRSR
jgi:hypothetical protein